VDCTIIILLHFVTALLFSYSSTFIAASVRNKLIVSLWEMKDALVCRWEYRGGVSSWGLWRVWGLCGWCGVSLVSTVAYAKLTYDWMHRHCCHDDH